MASGAHAASGSLAPQPKELVGQGGRVLHGYSINAPNPGFLVVAVHGMAEHSARYEITGRAVAEAGGAFWAYDQRGHGPGAQADGSLGHVADRDGFTLLTQDLFCVIDQARAACPGVPAFVLAQSMGSLVVRDYLHRYPDHAARLAGCVLSGTVGHPGLRGVVGLWYARALARIRGRRTPAPDLDAMVFGAYGARFRPPRTRFDWLSRDPAAVDAYVADPLCGFVCSTGFFVDLAEATLRVNGRRAARRTPKSVPVLVISGTRDPVGGFGTPVRRVAARYRSAGCALWRCVLYPDARHELYHETNADEVRRDVVSWMQEQHNRSDIS